MEEWVWVKISEGVSASTTIHEMGHNFGLNHAQRYTLYSEKITSDEGLKIDYGNPYSVMGSGGVGQYTTDQYGDVTIKQIGGDFTILIFKIQEREQVIPFHLTGADILPPFSADHDLEEGGDRPDNTFRVYRSDYDSPPISA